MAYIKNNWVDQEVERPRTYEMTNNSDGSVTLIDSFGLVGELGTPVNADNMNHIEEGIENNDKRITVLEGRGECANISLSNLSSEGEAHFDNKFVQKQGDAMSGNLTIHNGQNEGVLFLQNKTLDYNNYVKPSNPIQSGILQFVDKNHQFYGFFQQQIFVDGTYGLTIGQRRKINGQDVYCNIESFIDENGNCSCTIPDTVKIDGQWVNKRISILQNYTSPTVEAYTLQIDISQHLPYDSFAYELILSCDAYTGSVSGSSCAVTATGILPARMTIGQTRSNLAVGCGGSCIIPVQDRKIEILIVSEVRPANIKELWLEGYRRIGTNL